MSSPANNVPQFATAEYASTGERCKSCNQPVSGSYFRINGALACERCTTQLQSQIPKDSHAAFVKAILFGVGAAILGLILYAAFTIITSIRIVYVSLAVGWLVGKAMHQGSNGVGGRRYQITAALLTYAAVSMAAIPIAIAFNQKNKPPKSTQVQTSPSSPQPSSADPNSSEADAPSDDQTSSSSAKPKMSFFTAIGTLALVGLASPFLALEDPFHGAIGLIILFVGIRFAWKQTAAPPLDIIGPFKSTPAPPSNPAA
jgi:hypothetical protein